MLHTMYHFDEFLFWLKLWLGLVKHVVLFACVIVRKGDDVLGARELQMSSALMAPMSSSSKSCWVRWIHPRGVKTGHKMVPYATLVPACFITTLERLKLKRDELFHLL